MLLGLIVVWLLNFIVLLFASALAVNGDGTLGFAEVVLWVGGILIVLTAIMSLIAKEKKSPVSAFLFSASALPIGFFGILAFSSGSTFLRKNLPLDNEFASACLSAGATFFEKPQNEIKSIAYDWPPGSSAPLVSQYEVDSRANILSSRGSSLMIQKSLDFMESRCCRFEGVRMEKGTPYYRRSTGTITLIPELTADALVFYEGALISGKRSSAWIQYKITVSDRRNGRKLAKLTYLVDPKNKKACAGPGVLAVNESEFVSRAIGGI